MLHSPPGVFDLSSAEGVNESERLLMRLCRKSFLSLWAHANLHTAQDMREEKGSAKEFADVLVVQAHHAASRKASYTDSGCCRLSLESKTARPTPSPPWRGRKRRSSSP